MRKITRRSFLAAAAACGVLPATTVPVPAVPAAELDAGVVVALAVPPLPWVTVMPPAFSARNAVIHVRGVFQLMVHSFADQASM